MKQRPVQLLPVLTLIGSALAQSTWHVDAAGTAPGTGTQADPFTRIDYAVDQAAVLSGDTILIAPGDYVDEMIDPLGRDLVIEAVGGPQVTWISGPTGGADSPGPFLVFHGFQTPAMVVRGLTFRNFVGSFGTTQIVVGGVDSSPTFENCIFESNNGLGSDAAVDFIGGAPTFMNCKWIDNRSLCMGALKGVYSDFTIENCHFEDNRGAIHVEGGSALITGTSFVRNFNNQCMPNFFGTSIYGNGADLELRHVDAQGSYMPNGFPNGLRFFMLDGCSTLMEDSLLRSSYVPDEQGGLILAVGGDLTCRRVTFSSGIADQGGAVASSHCVATYDDCLFVGNRGDVEDYDGGALKTQGSGTLTVLDSTFLGNIAGAGGAIAVHDTPAVIQDSVFENNLAVRGIYLDGFMARGGAIWSTVAIEIDNCEFEGNRAKSFYPQQNAFMDNAYGGALYLAGGSVVRYSSFILNDTVAGVDSQGGAIFSTGMVQVNGSVFYGNQATESSSASGGAVFGFGQADRCTLVDSSSVGPGQVASGWSFSNSILEGSVGAPFAGPATVTYSMVSGGYPGLGNLDVDPRFWGVHDFHLQPGSHVVDAGDPGHAPDPDGSPVDMGAFTFDRDYCGPGCAGELGWTYCFGNANSVGQFADCFAFGSESVADNDVLLAVEGLPPSVFGYFLISPKAGYVPFFGGSMGNLCLGSPLLRWNDQIELSNLAGQVSRRLDLGNLPEGHVVAPSSDWSFQLWHRDMVMGQSTSNTSSALRIDFQ